MRFGTRVRLTSVRLFTFSIVAVLALTSPLLPQSAAVANTQATLTVDVTDATGTALASVEVTVCDQLLADEPSLCVSSLSDVDGVASFSLALSSPNAQVRVSAGGLTTNFSETYSDAVFVGGVLTGEPVVLTMITPVDDADPLEDHPGPQAPAPAVQEPTPGIPEEIQSFGLDGITTSSVVEPYELSGTVTFEGRPVPNLRMSVSSFTPTWVCHDLTTNSGGFYSVEFGSSEGYFSLQTCEGGGVYRAPEYDRPSGFNFEDLTGQAQTFDIGLTRTAVDLTVTEAVSPGQSIPAPHLEVRLTRVSGSGLSVTSTTNSQGVARFVGLEPNVEYLASYERPIGEFQLQKFEAKTNSAAVLVGALNTTRFDSLSLTRLSSAPATPVQINGQVVTGLLRTPIADALIYVNWSSNASPNTFMSVDVRTDIDGRYSVVGLPYGNTFISVNAPGFRPTGTQLTTSAARGDVYSRGTVNLRPSPQGGLIYSGTLREFNRGPEISGMRLTLWGGGGMAPRNVVTSITGEFSFDNLPAGVYHLHADVWSSDSLYAQLPRSSSTVTLNESQTAILLELGRRAATNATASGRIAGYADTSGEQSAIGLEGVELWVGQKNGGTAFRTVTNAQGEWAVAGLVDDEEYSVWASADYSVYEVPLQTAFVTARSSGGVPHQILLKRVSAGPGSLTGRVRNAKDYTNLAGIEVQMWRNNGGVNVPSVVTNSRGEYSFTDLPAGEYGLFISDGRQSFNDAYMSVEISSRSNRVNALITPILASLGTISGTVLDERGLPLARVAVEAWDPKNAKIGGWASTDEEGRYALAGLPTDLPLNFRVTPGYELQYEVASFLSRVTLPAGQPSSRIDVTLAPAAFITGMVNGIPQSGNVPAVWAELITSDGSVIAGAYVDPATGSYAFGSVPAGSYVIRFTQRAAYSGYTGDSGGGFEPAVSEPASLKPVYWDGSLNGASVRSGALGIIVAAGDRLSGKSVTLTPGSSISGTLFVETDTGSSPLTGARSVGVQAYQKQADGSWAKVGNPEGAEGSAFKIVGLGAGTYKLEFEDQRKGANSLSTSFSGNADSFGQAREIVVGEEESIPVTQIMSFSLPELSAEAFDLDELGASRLTELEDQITIDGELVSGTEELVFVGVEFAGEFVSAFANSTPTSLGGWKRVNSQGYISVLLPSSLGLGAHRVAVQDANRTVIGWSAVTVTGSSPETTTPPADRPAVGLPNSTPKQPSRTLMQRPPVADAAPLEVRPADGGGLGEIGVDSGEPEQGLPESIDAATPMNENRSTDSFIGAWVLYLLGGVLLIGAAVAAWRIRVKRS